jgi:hypothetical protein
VGFAYLCLDLDGQRLQEPLKGSPLYLADQRSE